ncbi:hypothetical protein AAZX31_15G008300 [Glycine max]
MLPYHKVYKLRSNAFTPKESFILYPVLYW